MDCLFSINFTPAIQWLLLELCKPGDKTEIIKFGKNHSDMNLQNQQSQVNICQRFDDLFLHIMPSMIRNAFLKGKLELNQVDTWSPINAFKNGKEMLLNIRINPNYCT